MQAVQRGWETAQKQAQKQALKQVDLHGRRDVVLKVVAEWGR